MQLTLNTHIFLKKDPDTEVPAKAEFQYDPPEKPERDIGGNWIYPGFEGACTLERAIQNSTGEILEREEITEESLERAEKEAIESTIQEPPED